MYQTPPSGEFIAKGIRRRHQSKRCHDSSLGFHEIKYITSSTQIQPRVFVLYGLEKEQ
jgi:hypothetical protein